MGYLYRVVAVPEYHVPSYMKDAVGAFVNLGVVKEEVLIGEELPDVYKIDKRERHLNLIDRVENSILLENLLQNRVKFLELTLFFQVFFNCTLLFSGLKTKNRGFCFPMLHCKWIRFIMQIC